MLYPTKKKINRLPIKKKKHRIHKKKNLQKKLKKLKKKTILAHDQSPFLPIRRRPAAIIENKEKPHDKKPSKPNSSPHTNEAAQSAADCGNPHGEECAPRGAPEGVIGYVSGRGVGVPLLVYQEPAWVARRERTPLEVRPDILQGAAPNSGQKWMTASDHGPTLGAVTVLPLLVRSERTF